MDRCFISPSVKFKRIDGLIHATCDVAIKEGDIVCYEIPAKSTGTSLKLDILRYTMQCVYSGESLFPCAFNQEAPGDDVKVFFDYVFRTKYKREVSEKLALSLYAKNQYPKNYTESKFVFKTLGIFDKSEDSNCRGVSYENGETFLAASKDIAINEVLTTTKNSITVPSFKEEKDFELTLRLMSKLDISNINEFTKALSYREKAALVRPDSKFRVVVINSGFDAGLEKRMAKYKMDREMGIATFHAGVERLSKKATRLAKKNDEPEDMGELEEMFNRLSDAFESRNGRGSTEEEDSETDVKAEAEEMLRNSFERNLNNVTK